MNKMTVAVKTIVMIALGVALAAVVHVSMAIIPLALWAHYGSITRWYISGVAAGIVMLAYNPIKRLLTAPTVRVVKIRTVRGPAPETAQPQYLWQLDPGVFEDVVADMLRGEGYLDVRRCGGAGDLSVDIMAIHPSDGLPVAVQCKRYQLDHRVGTPEVQQFIGMVYTHHGIAPGHSIYATSSDYTTQAYQLGEAHGIMMLNGEALTSLLNGQRSAR